MTKYRKIIQLTELNLSPTNIDLSYNAQKITVNKVLKVTSDQDLVLPLGGLKELQIHA